MDRTTLGAGLAALTAIVACHSDDVRSVPSPTRALDPDASLARESPQALDAGSSCVEVDASKAQTIDFDDGVHGLITYGYSDVTVYIQRDGCFRLDAHCNIGAPIAFVSVGARGSSARELSVETWLVHGDRRRQHYRMTKSHCLETGLPEEIPGPRRPRR